MKRVFVLSRHSMFSNGIQALLSQEADIEIVDWSSLGETAVACIHSLHPDVVIINCDDPEPDLRPALSCILHERMGISVIGMSLRDNQISIHRGEQKQIANLGDLLDTIRT